MPFTSQTHVTVQGEEEEEGEEKGSRNISQTALTGKDCSLLWPARGKKLMFSQVTRYKVLNLTSSNQKNNKDKPQYTYSTRLWLLRRKGAPQRSPELSEEYK